MRSRARQLLLVPSRSSVTLAERQFYAKSPEAVDLLETIGEWFLRGYGNALRHPTIPQTQARLDAVPRRYRGFSYEGAAMGYAMLDALRIVRRPRLPHFLHGAASCHIYLACVGVGWALARLPRLLWRRIRVTDPLLRWLVLDGYGFHQAYFHTAAYVERQQRAPAGPWPGGLTGGYVDRAVDQGIGRALWFVEGTDVDRLAARIETFAAARRADLWSGAGLAVTYAGGANERELRTMWSLAGDHQPAMAQGSAFGAEARVRADLVTNRTALATEVLCGMAPEPAAAIVRQIRDRLPSRAQLPSYELWRQRVAEQLTGKGRC